MRKDIRPRPAIAFSGLSAASPELEQSRRRRFEGLLEMSPECISFYELQVKVQTMFMMIQPHYYSLWPNLICSLIHWTTFGYASFGHGRRSYSVRDSGFYWTSWSQSNGLLSKLCFVLYNFKLACGSDESGLIGFIMPFLPSVVSTLLQKERKSEARLRLRATYLIADKDTSGCNYPSDISHSLYGPVWQSANIRIVHKHSFEVLFP